VVLEEVVIVRPAGAPAAIPKAGVTPATAGNDTVPAVPGIAINVETELPGLAEVAGTGADVLPPEHPAAIVAARNIPTKMKRR
jgi:hypothetical protein